MKVGVTMFKKGDLLLGIMLLLIIIASFNLKKIWLPATEKTIKTALIMQNGTIVRSINLNQASSEKISLPGRYKVIIAVAPGKIRFQHSDCPDKICVKTGWLSKVGDLAACVPAKVVIEIKGQANQTDAVTY